MTALTAGGFVVHSRARVLLAATLSLLFGNCYDFHQEGPEDPDPLPISATTTIEVEYVQPSRCRAVSRPCTDLVVFFGSWRQKGHPVPLTPDPTNRVWTGVVSDVPVNFPPDGSPYAIRIYDPYLQSDGVVRYTGRRVTLGGQALTHIELPGAHDEHALVYVDAQGQGHNPF